MRDEERGRTLSISGSFFSFIFHPSSLLSVANAGQEYMVNALTR
jgi:hypothetical protein